MAKIYIPNRGDIIWTDFNPAAGHEQKGKRPALVLSSIPFNKTTMLAMVASITSRVRGHGFEVVVSGKEVSGVALCQQVKMIDCTAVAIVVAVIVGFVISAAVGNITGISDMKIIPALSAISLPPLMPCTTQ